MKFTSLHFVWTEGKNPAITDLLNRNINEGASSKIKESEHKKQENIKFLIAKSQYSSQIECHYHLCYVNNNQEYSTEKSTHYPVLAHIAFSISKLR